MDLTDYTDPGVYTIPGTVVNDTYPGVTIDATVEIGVVITVPEPPATVPPTENGG